MLSGKGAAILCCFGCDCESIVFLGFVNTVFFWIFGQAEVVMMFSVIWINLTYTKPLHTDDLQSIRPTVISPQ